MLILSRKVFDLTIVKVHDTDGKLVGTLELRVIAARSGEVKLGFHADPKLFHIRRAELDPLEVTS